MTTLIIIWPAFLFPSLNVFVVLFLENAAAPKKYSKSNSAETLQLHLEINGWSKESKELQIFENQIPLLQENKQILKVICSLSFQAAKHWLRNNWCKGLFL